MNSPFREHMESAMTTDTQPISVRTASESAHDILRTCEHPLDAIFAPRVVAVIGATERKRSVGRTVMANLINGGFPGVVYPVNPIQDSFRVLKLYQNDTNLPEKHDLDVNNTPPPPVQEAHNEKSVHGVPAPTSNPAC